MSIHQEIDIILDEILEVEGVTGVIATDTDGKIIATKMPSIYDEENLDAISCKIAKTLANIRLFSGAFEEVIYHSPEMRLIIKDLKRGFLAIMSLPLLSPPLLNVATNAARKKITRILTFRKGSGQKALKITKSPETTSNLSDSTIKDKKI